MKKQLTAWLVLGLITVVAGLSLSVTNEVTKEPIQNQAVLAEAKAKQEVLPAAEAFEEVELPEDAGISLFAGKVGEETIGFVGKVTVNGYGGPIDVIAGIDNQGLVKGINVGGPSFSETAGLGAKSRETEFTSQFADKVSPIRVVKASDPKTDSSVDSITAATITSNAVVGGVNRIAKQVDVILNPQEEGPETTTAEGITYTASQQGFAGPVAVFVTVKEDGTITALKVGDDKFAETEGYGANALSDDFTGQFVGKALPLKGEDVEAISGASITTKAVIAAINQAYDEKKAVGPAAPAGVVYSASKQGFAGPVAVNVTIDNATITALSIGDDQFSETEGYGAQALEPDFAKQFIGKSLPIAMNDIEAISGATFTSQAVIDAINDAFEQSKTGDSDNDTAQETEPVETAEPEVIPEAELDDESDMKTASKQGFAGPVAVQVAFNEDGSIKVLMVGDDAFAETPGLGAKAKDAEFTDQFVGKLPPLALRKADEEASASTIDGITSATVTSHAVVDAINEVFEQLKAVTDDTTEEETEPFETAEPEVPPEAEPADESDMKTASKQGFAGPVAVQVAFNEDGSIKALTVGDDAFAETPGLGAKAKDAEFTDQFVGKLPPLALRKADEEASASTIDGITSATVTSQAVVDAINEVFEQLKAVTDDTTEEETEPFETAEPEVTPEAEPADESDMKTASKQGFAGPVAVQVAFNEDGSIKALTVGDDAFAETPGLGAKAKDAEFTDQFVGKLPPLALRKADEEASASTIDGITSATVTSQAVVDAINEVFEQLKAVTDDTTEEETEPFETAEPEVPPEAEPADESDMKTASKQGFAGPVAVQVAFNEDGSIKALTVGDDAFAETPGLGAKAKDAEFTDQFVGKLPPLALRKADEEASASTIDGITSATVTSQAVVDAVNEAAAAGIVEEDDAPSAEELKVYTAEAQGYSGPVAVEVSFTQDNKIAQIKIGDDRFNETPGLGAKALEEDFVSQFIGKSLPIAKEDIDAITAATMTTQAVIDAINLAYEAYQKEALPLADEGDAAMVVSKQGFAGSVAVQVTFNKDGSIKALTVGDDAFAETPGLGAKAKDAEFTDQFVGKLPPLALRKADEEASATTIDGITSATMTSQAVIDAVNEAFEQLKK
ncbi:MAG: FMN-binding protein [Christensenellales bacterium]